MIIVHIKICILKPLTYEINVHVQQLFHRFELGKLIRQLCKSECFATFMQVRTFSYYFAPTLSTSSKFPLCNSNTRC